MRQTSTLQIPIGKDVLEGDLNLLKNAARLIIFVHGSGSSRTSSRNQFVANSLNEAGFSTLLFDLLTHEEEKIDDITAEYRFNIKLLTERLLLVTDWVVSKQKTLPLSIGYFGASTGAAAALLAAAQRPKLIKAIVSRGGRPDLAEDGLKDVESPTLLLVGGQDPSTLQVNTWAFDKLHCQKKILIIPKASHLFEEPGKLEEVAKLATQWFKLYL